MATMKQQEKASTAWFSKLIKGAGASALEKQRMGLEVFKPQKDPFVGGMFFFLYDPKYKDKLPWWDKFPLVVPFDVNNDGFIGLNLHYLPPGPRKALIEKLVSYKKKAGSPDAYMKISYPLLKQAARSVEFEACIHRYLFSQMRSQLVKVDDSAWVNATMLPVQQFQGASARKVWSNR